MWRSRATMSLCGSRKDATDSVVCATRFSMKALTDMLRETTVAVVRTYWMLRHQRPDKGKKHRR